MNICIKQNNGEIRKIGTYEDGEFHSVRKKSEHLFYKLNAWGLDVKTFENLLEEGLELITIMEVEEGKVYKTNPDKMKEYGIYKHFLPFRKQIFLPLKYWEVYDEDIGD